MLTTATAIAAQFYLLITISLIISNNNIHFVSCRRPRQTPLPPPRTPTNINDEPPVTLTYPQVELGLPYNADADCQNTSQQLLIVTNSNAGFLLNCTAPYPIHWVAYNEDGDDGTLEESKWTESKRIVEDYKIPSTYSYFIILHLQYKDKILTFTNFSCSRAYSAAAVDLGLEDVHAERQVTYVTMTSPDPHQKNVISLEVLGDHGVPKSWKHFQHPTGHKQGGDAEGGDGDCSAHVSVSGLEKQEPCFRCSKPDKSTTISHQQELICGQQRGGANFDADAKEDEDRDRLELDFRGCVTANECELYFKRQNKGTQCLRKTPPNEPVIGCGFSPGEDYNPKFILCKNYGVALVQYYYFSVLKPNQPRNIFFSWSEINPFEMLYIHPLESETLYIGQMVTFYCELNEEAVPSSGTFISNVTIEITYPLPKKIYCMGPVWNTTEWIKTEMKLNIVQGTSPSIANAVEVTRVSFTLGEQDVKLSCDVEGDPFPDIGWEAPPNKQFTISTQHEGNKGSSSITLDEVTLTSRGRYACIASSFKGNARRVFLLEVSDQYKHTLTIVLSVILPLIALIIILLVLFWRKIKAQQAQLRSLTDLEIKEFEQGNPEVHGAGKDKNGYFDNNVAIDAMPYDARYEIPMEQLKIDESHLLGSGAFGKVYRGTILGLTAGPADSKYKQQKGTSSAVAIKTVSPNVDVVYFKALLSEIKIMAYLGNHKNLVSLIGANTQDIRNRRAFIAVELCAKGSLENYLRENRTRLANYVKYGILTGAENHSMEGNYENVAAVHTRISTYDLFKWCYDVAQGLEYLHSKRVIHGDLATRNILLNSDAVAKVGDFGLSRQLVGSANYTKKTMCPLPWKWMAPESLRDSEYSVKSDIWAYGITIWEIFSLAEKPYLGRTMNEEFMNEIQNGMRLDKPVLATNEIYEFMLQCWNYKPRGRPDLSPLKTLCKGVLMSVVPEGYFMQDPAEQNQQQKTTATSVDDVVENNAENPDSNNDRNDGDGDGYLVPYKPNELI